MEERFNRFLYESRNDILLSCVVFIYEYMHKPFFKYIPSIDALTGDTSGEIIRTEMLNKDNLSSPIEFLDFYTGNTSASYCGGNGWFYDTIETDLRHYIDELIFGEYLKKFVEDNTEEILKEYSIDKDVSAICEFLLFEDILGDCNIDTQMYVNDFLRVTDWKLLDEIYLSRNK